MEGWRGGGVEGCRGGGVQRCRGGGTTRAMYRFSTFLIKPQFSSTWLTRALIV